MKTRATICLLSAGTMALSSCSTAYTPRPSPRVAMVMKGGTPGYARNGKVYEGGIFGGNLDEAVRGNAEAEAHASSFQSGMIGGFVSTMLGSAAVGGGAVLVATESGHGNQEANSSGQTAGLALMVGGLAAYVVGIVLMSNAQPHLFDAINVYNDSVDPGPLAPTPQTTVAPAAAAPPAPTSPAAATPPVPTGSAASPSTGPSNAKKE